MRYGIFSDIHSNLEALQAVIQAYQNDNIDKYLCIGDLVGYAANPGECIKEIKQLAPVSVAGNHDWASVNLFSLDYFNPVAKQAILWTMHNLSKEDCCFLESLKLLYKNADLVLVHGTLDNPKDFNYLSSVDAAEGAFGSLDRKVCFLGHTHVAGFFIQGRNGLIEYRQNKTIVIEKGNKYLINVGSVGQPRDGNPDAAYCIYDTQTKKVQIKRVKYNKGLARKKIIKAGLPEFLGDRLLTGQ